MSSAQIDILEFERKHDLVCVPKTHLPAIDNLSKLMVLISSEAINARYLSENSYERNRSKMRIEGRISNELAMRRTRVLLRKIRKYNKENLLELINNLTTNVIKDTNNDWLYAYLTKLCKHKKTSQQLRHQIKRLFKNELYQYSQKNQKDETN